MAKLPLVHLGSFEIVVNTEESDVGVEYEIAFSQVSSNDLPKNLLLSLDGKEWNFEDGIHGIIDANADAQTVTHIVEWNWAYETANDTGDTAKGDETDTMDGQNAFEYVYAITARGTQTRPVME